MEIYPVVSYACYRIGTIDSTHIAVPLALRGGCSFLAYFPYFEITK
jgi:hypothetical protein